MDLDKLETVEETVNQEEPKKRKRGRPKGKWVDKPRQWQPKKWKPDYENMCHMKYVLGMTEAVIAERLNYTREMVNNVTNSEQGKAFGKYVIERVREKTTGSIDDRLAKLADVALGNIEHVLSDPEVRKDNPLGVVDRSFKVLEGKGLMKAANAESSLGSRVNNVTNNNTQNNFILADKEAMQSLMAGLNKSLEARKTYEESKLARVSNAIGALPEG